MPDLFPPDVRKGAVLSECGRYRYRLTRVWDAALPVAHWVMLNPSVADATIDDPTIRRVVGFSKAWGFGGADVRNLFALRATDPKELRAADDPVGPDNDSHLTAVPAAAVVVAAWGAGGGLFGRDLRVLRLLRDAGVAMSCLGTTKQQQPRHPLYVGGDAKLIPFG